MSECNLLLPFREFALHVLQMTANEVCTEREITYQIHSLVQTPDSSDMIWEKPQQSPFFHPHILPLYTFIVELSTLTY